MQLSKKRTANFEEQGDRPRQVGDSGEKRKLTGHLKMGWQDNARQLYAAIQRLAPQKRHQKVRFKGT